MDFHPPQCGSARTAPHRRTVTVAPSHRRTVAPSHRHASSDYGADAARQGNSAQCTYVRTPKIHVFYCRHSGVARARAPHRRTVAPRQEA